MDGATGNIYSSPDDAKSTCDVFASIAQIEQALRCTFQGWSEDIGGLRVIEQGDEMISDADVDVVRIGHSEIGGWDMNDTHSGKNDKIYMDAWKGKAIGSFIRAQWQAGATFRSVRQAQADFYKTWCAKVGELSTNPSKAELKALQDALVAEQQKVTETEAKLAEELAKPPEVVTQTITHNVPAPLTWKTVAPWIAEQFKRLIRRK
jgi:hypothetical protein